jgi:hypothetical protein
VQLHLRIIAVVLRREPPRLLSAAGALLPSGRDMHLSAGAERVQPPPPTSCPTGQVQVTTCGMSTTPASTPSTTEADCPGSCRIDGDLACCPERIDGSCEMYCCDASGCS